MRTIVYSPFKTVSYLLLILLIFPGCSESDRPGTQQVLPGLKSAGLDPVVISASDFYNGIEPFRFSERAGAPYKPSMNEDPGIPAQCWIETGYGTQNACKYCHTDYLTSIEHGNAYPIGEDQILFSFPTPRLNNILWQNIIYPERILTRLAEENIELPVVGDNDYIRQDNWLPAYRSGRSSNNGKWINHSAPDGDMKLFPDLNPEHLFPYNEADPTSGGTHGYIDQEGFVRNEKDGFTGWRAINFFPYAVFTPLTGSVSGIYIRLPDKFMSRSGTFSLEVYKENLELLEANIKNAELTGEYYVGDAGDIRVQKGFYPEGTEFVHPLHYVDLNADGEYGDGTNGIAGGSTLAYEFPGTRSKRIKEIRYMYKWKDVGLEDIAPEDEEDDASMESETEESFEYYIGREGEGWVESGTGWILAGFIENREGELRTQTTEELAQCVGCHAKTGNTIDGVWSFQRKLPGTIGWSDMSYGEYRESDPESTRLHDYIHSSSGMGEMGYFLHTVVGADLYGLMPLEIAAELKDYAIKNKLEEEIGLQFPLDEILDDVFLKDKKREERKPRLLERQKVMRHYSRNYGYLRPAEDGEELFIKGSILFPSQETMDANIRGYRMIVLDQSFNLGKDMFGSVNDNVPFTFRSDGEVPDSDGRLIPAGEVIYSRPWDSNGVGYTPTGIVEVNDQGSPVDADGNPVDLQYESDRAVGHLSSGGTFDLFYNPILSGIKVRRK
jgi:hypothetical protein